MRGLKKPPPSGVGIITDDAFTKTMSSEIFDSAISKTVKEYIVPKNDDIWILAHLALLLIFLGASAIAMFANL